MATAEAIANNPNAKMMDVTPSPAPTPALPSNKPPSDWDQGTYDNFKKANPTLEPTAQDTSKMQGTAYTSVSPTQAKQPPQEPAVVSSTTIGDKVIPQNNDTFKNLSDKGTYVDQGGTMRYSDGTLVPAPVGTDSNSDGTWGSGGEKYGAPPNFEGGDLTDPSVKAVNDLLAGMKQSLDAGTKKQIDVIEQNHAILTQQMQAANESAGSATQRALLTSGTARYAPADAGGQMMMQTSIGLQKLQSLDAQENTALASAEKAQNDGNQQIFDKALADVQAIRTAKQTQATKIADAQQAQIKKAQDDQIQSSRDSAVASLVSQGITDPKQLLDYLNFDDKGRPTGDFTAAEIQTTLKNLLTSAPPGVSDLVKTLQTNGAPPDVIQKVLASKDMTSAYAAAGDYASSGGTGIIGEYNYYKAQAKAAGQTPVDFNTYQNEDANRKKSLAVTNNYNGTGAPGTLSKAGQAWVTAVQNGNSTMASVPAALKNEVALGLANTDTTSYSPLAASRFTTAANKMTSKYIDLPQYQLTANGLPYLQRIDAAMKNPGSISDQDLLDSLTKLNTAGNAISDAQVKVITDGASTWDNVNKMWQHVKNGGVLSTNQRDQIQKIAKGIFTNYQKGYQPVYDKATKELKAAGIPEPFWGIPNLNQLSAEIDTGTSDQLVAQGGQSANDLLNSMGTMPGEEPAFTDGPTFWGNATQ